MTPFRCREFAALGAKAHKYQHVKSLLPRDPLMRAQYRASKAAYWQRRLLFQQELLADMDADACSLGIATCWWRRFLNDNSGSELMGPGTLFGYLELKGITEITPGHPMTSHTTGFRRTANYLRSLQTSKRPTNSERIAVSDCVLFDAVWHEAELTYQFLEMLAANEFVEDVPECVRKRLTEPAIRYANERLDQIDQSVFGGIVPHVPHAFKRIVKFWQELGIEWLVTREALQEFQPDSLLC